MKCWAVLWAILTLAQGLICSGDCINFIRSSGWRPFVAYRVFSNSSLAVIDTQGRYAVLDASGNTLYQETMNLPIDSITNQRANVVFATISSAGTIFLNLDDGYSYKYSAKAVSLQSPIAKKPIMDLFPIYGLPDMALAGFQAGLMGFSVDFTGSKMDGYNNVNVLITGPSAGTTQSPYNQTYWVRVSVNPLLNEFYIVLTSTTISVGKVILGSPNTMNITNANYLSSMFKQTDAYTIPTSVGTTANYMAYVYYLNPRNPSTYKYTQYLVLHKRGFASTITYTLNDFFVYSVALHPTLPKIYLLTTHGDLYVMAYTPGTPPSITAGYSLVVYGFYFKYAQLDVLSSTTMLLRTIDSLAVYDLTTDTIKYHLSVKPSFGRDIPGGNMMFLVYHNLYVKLYDTSTHAISSSFIYSCAIKEIVLNKAASNPRFYILCKDQVLVYTTATYSLVTSKTIAQIASSITPAVNGIVELFDIDILIYDPTSLVLTAWVTTSGATRETGGMLLTENTLAFINYESLNSDLMCQQISVINRPDQPTTADYLYLNCQDYIKFYMMYSSPIIWYYDVDQDSTVLANYADWDIFNTFSFVGQSTGTKTMNQEQSGVQTISKTFNGQKALIPIAIPTGVLGGFEIYYMPFPYLKGMDKSLGNLTYISFSLTYAYSSLTNNFDYFSTQTYANIQSTNLLPGVPYQNADNIVYVTGGDDYVYYLSLTQCYNDPSLSDYITVSLPPSVSNCASANNFNAANCKLCSPGYYPSADGTTCVAICAAAEWLLNSQCLAMCPIEYYKYSGTPNQCLTPLQCVANSKVIIGDRCTVSTCPTGFTVNATSYCIANTATTAAMWNQVTGPVTACPGGTLYWYHYSQCTPTNNLPTANYKWDSAASPSPGVIYCDPLTHFYDLGSLRCNPTCYTYSWTSATMGKVCASKVACTALAYYTDDTVVPGQCVSSCSSRPLQGHHRLGLRYLLPHRNIFCSVH